VQDLDSEVTNVSRPSIYFRVSSFEMAFPLQAEVKEWDECLAMLGEDEGATVASERLGEGNSMELNGEGREINVSPLPKIYHVAQYPIGFSDRGALTLSDAHHHYHFLP
jgi:hypothetical protein